MNIKSMTGFGKASFENAEIKLDIVLKTVNGRFFDVRFHMGRGFQEYESDIKRTLQKKILRSTVDLSVHAQFKKNKPQVSFDQELAKTWLDGFSKVTRSLKISDSSKADWLLGVSELYKVETTTLPVKREKQLLLKTLMEAIESCCAQRAKEGQETEKEIKRLLGSLKKIVGQFKKLRSQVEKGLAEKYNSRLKKWLKGREVDATRMTQEVAILIEKSDVSEEIQRLEAHIRAIESLISKKGPHGKKLDFFAQELLREVNTLGSKSVSAEMTERVVSAKGLVEKFREQVQNIE